MALILCLETSASFCGVALHQDGKLLAIREVQEPQAHAAKLSLLIKEIISASGISSKQLQAIAISSGPGSYTGLRIGTSTAKGMCYALNIPLISVRTLDLLASQALLQGLSGGLLCPMIDAKRMEVYCQIMDQNLKVVSPVEAKVIDESSFAGLLDRDRIYFFGDGAEKCKNTICSPNAFFIDAVYPSVTVLGKMAEDKYGREDFEDLTHFTPFYLKDFIAKKAQPVFPGA
jgi:tRNA threonylcarbamoyladenosine biosynthesis protein TsaB